MTTVAATLSVRPLTSAVGAEIEGLDLSVPLDAATLEAVHDAFLRYQVLFFRGQEMGPEAQRRFSEYFGPVVLPVIDTQSTEEPGVTVLDQIAPKRQFTDHWHSDHMFTHEPPLGTMLRAVQLPSLGGDTCFASMYAAYEALSPAMRDLLDPLTAIHSTEKVRAVVEPESRVFMRAKSNENSIAVHPVVRVHPETGRRLLFVSGNFTTRILELEEAESRAILDFLFEHIKSPQFQCRFRWEANSVAFWDNRAVQHCAMPDYNERRLMHRTMIAGDAPFGPTTARAAAEGRREFPPSILGKDQT